MKRWVVALAVFLPSLSGCLYYAYPTLSHTPELPVANPDGSVHAFRIDVDRTDRKPQPPSTQYTLSRIPMDERGLIPSQLEVAPATGLLNPLGVIEGGQHDRSDFTLLVRAYRPGFKTQEVKAWEKSRELPWIPAPDLVAQEKAIDDLLADPGAPEITNLGSNTSTGPQKETWWSLKDQKSPALGLQPGAGAKTQRDALLFAASEYQRLAGSPAAATPNMQAIRQRLQQKAQWLRTYADQAPTP